MLMINRENAYSRVKSPAFWLAVLGALKLATDAFGLVLISDDQINAIANGISAIIAVIGVAAGWEA